MVEARDSCHVALAAKLIVYFGMCLDATVVVVVVAADPKMCGNCRRRQYPFPVVDS